ncbi:hypothetical protein [Pseudoblastomonas halimionae]|uniref:hypothetical protein n=1 Tax=Alteriqipengyuania halimionae TaxID=1926630 RepID=UPI00136BED8B|nr:hypothetical protein [Alteriqipengyuania halimionae]
MALAALGLTPAPVMAQEFDTSEQAPTSFYEALLAGPFELTRSIEHVLSDGATIVVTRTYRLRVAPSREGWLIEGEPIEVTVESPPSLAALAQIERERDDSGVFPMRLSREGSLLPYEAPRSTDRASLGAAENAIVRRIADEPLSADDAERTTIALRALSARAAGERTAWPRDLFRPSAASRIESRDVSGGSVTVALEAEADERTGLVRSYERRVTTRIGNGERMVRERWELQRSEGE